MPTLLQAFDGLPDPRMERTRLHSLRDIVILSILAVFDGIQHDSHVEETHAHDRDEVRRVWTSSELDWLPEAEA